MCRQFVFYKSEVLHCIAQLPIPENKMVAHRNELLCNNYIPEISGYYGFGPDAVSAEACVSRNCDANARIKFIFYTAIDDLVWKNPIDFGANRKN